MPATARKLSEPHQEKRMEELIGREGKFRKAAGKLDNKQFLAELDKEMARHGYGKVDEAAIKKRLVADKLWDARKKFPLLMDGEHAYNRGLGNGNSNFYLFVKETSKGVLVYFSDPGAKPGAGPKEICIATGYWGQDCARRAKEVMKQILQYASKKPENEFWALTHHHWGFRGRERIVDDGVSRFQDTLRMMMLYNYDVDMSSPHNALERRFIVLLRVIEDGIGMVKVPGTELTFTLEDDEENGPHGNVYLPYAPEAIDEFERRILSKRDQNLRMQSYFRGMTMDQMLEAIEDMRKRFPVVLAFTHPINYNDPFLRIMSVGLMSAVQNTGLSLQRAIKVAGMADIIECWNPTMCSKTEVPFTGDKGRQLKEFLTECIDEGHNVHASRGNFWGNHYVNTLNMAFAEYMMRKYGLNTMFGGDDHCTLPMDYNPGGDILGMGYTKVKVLPELFDKLIAGKRKMTSEEILRGIRAREITMRGVVHTVQGRGGPVMDPARTHVPDEKKNLAAMLGQMTTGSYADALLSDFLYFLATGKWNEIGNMPG